jgi:hypothetical protein
MRRIIYFILVLAIVGNMNAYALDNTLLLDLRNKIFDESKEIKPLLADSRNIVLLNNMWDACIIAVSQLDAYFFMIGIFDEVTKDKWNEEAVNYLELWLVKIKNTDELNIKILGSLPPGLEAITQVHGEKLKNYFIDLNDAIDDGLKTISKLKEAVKANK